MIMNIFYPDQGKIRIFEDVMKGSSTDRIGYLPEERGMYKKMKVREFIQFYGELKSGRKVKKETDYWLDRLSAEGPIHLDHRGQSRADHPGRTVYRP